MINITGKIEKEIEGEELSNYIGLTVMLHGIVYKIRNMSGFSFVILRTKRSLIQCVLSKEFTEVELNELKEEVSGLKENDSIELTGEIVKEERAAKGYEVRIKSITILGRAEEELPVVINNKEIVASLETKLDFRPITLRNEKERAIFKIQEGICIGARKFLQENMFTEIHSPKIVFAGAEGGANIFKLDYFGKEAYLSQSPQFYKQMMVGVYERVYEIGGVYRAEKHDTARHLNEYLGLDFEMGFIHEFTEIMEMETGMLKWIMGYLKEYYKTEVELLKVEIPDIVEIPSIRFIEAKELISKTYNREIKDKEDLEPEEERLLCEIIKKETDSDFVFVTHYPTSKRPFYAMEDPEDKEYTLSFDLLFRGIEITTGGQRIHGYKEQLKKMQERNMNPELFESFLMIHKYGMPPHGGLGMGVERFTMCLLNKKNVRETTSFPRDLHRLVP